jgi:pyridoxal phosphate enzyme (YggS family)
MRSATAVADNLATVRRHIHDAAIRVGREAADIRLVAVSKTFGPERVRDAAAAGQVAFGENRVQEGLEKVETLADLDLEWHLIGHLQVNKARRAAAAFPWIHAIDSRRLLARLDRAAVDLGTRPNVLIQVDLAHEATKYGADESSLDELVAAAVDARAVRLRGLMILPPFADDPEASRPWFRRLRDRRDRLIADGTPADRLTELSMGMSHDFTVAIEEGASIVRVGTAVFGRRSPDHRA